MRSKRVCLFVCFKNKESTRISFEYSEELKSNGVKRRETENAMALVRSLDLVRILFWRIGTNDIDEISENRRNV